MAITSYGKITIIDVTDIGNFSVYPYANGPNTQVYNEENSTYYPDWARNPLILTPVVTYAGQDVTLSSTVNWYLKTDLIHPITTGFNSTNKTLTVDTNISIGNTYIVYVVKASYETDTGAHVEAEGEITFSLLTQHSSIKNVSISGTNVIKYASDSNTPSPPTVTLTATLTGESYLTADGWQYYDGNDWLNASGVSGLTVNGKELTVAASYNNNAAYFISDIAKFKYVTHATANSSDIYEDIYTVFQLRDGASGSELVTMDLTNDDQLVPINQSGTVQWSAIGDLAGTTVHIYEGRNDITSNTTKVSNLKATLTNVTVELYNNSGTKYSGNWTSGSNLPTGYYTVKVVGFTNNATGGSVRFDATVNGLNYNKTFSILGQTAGTDGKTPTIYTLDFPSIPAYVNNPIGNASQQTLRDNWTYAPDRLTINAYLIVTDANGISTRNPYNGRVWYTPNIVDNQPEKDAMDNYTWGSLDLSNGEGTLEAASKLLVNYSPYTFRLVGPTQDNIPENKKDEECINIVTDGHIGNAGNNGNDAINLLIDNENIILNATEGGETRAQTITVGYQGYIGATEDNHFALAASPNHFSSSKPGLVSSVVDNQSHNQVTITFNSGVSVGSAGEGETGTITLNFVYTDTSVTPNTTITISKVISWNAKLDAKDGESAIYLTFEYGGNKTTYFKNGDGSTKVTPVLIQNGTNLLTGKTVGTDYTVVWTDLISNNTVALDSDNITAIITAASISGIGSYSCAVTYPKTNGKTYTQYVSFTDYSDPLQVELISTIGDKLTNGIGEGIVYPQTTRNGITLDQISSNSLVAWGYNSAPSNPNQGDVYFNTTENSLYKCTTAGSWGSAIYTYDQVIVLMSTGNPIIVKELNTTTNKYSRNSEFSSVTNNLSYKWSFRDANGDVINPNTLTDLKVSYINSTTAPTITSTLITGGQFIYINKDVVNKKIVILCQVIKS